jgi:hypothetical protein
MTLSEVIERIKSGELQAPHCVICKKAADITGVFVPDDNFALRLGVATKETFAEGKTACAIYGLCKECALIEGIDTIVENKLLESRGQGGTIQ